jgi:hypothetical protein
MEAEIALPLDAALEAIDFFEQEGWDALGCLTFEPPAGASAD